MWHLKPINPINKIIGNKGKTKLTKTQIRSVVNRIKRDKKSKNVLEVPVGYFCEFCGDWHDYDDPRYFEHFVDGAPAELVRAFEMELARQRSGGFYG